MKRRTGFVSNSSSSSFICDICGEEASGWDLDMEDAEMRQCANGHTFCTSHMMRTFDDFGLDAKKKFMREHNYFNERWPEPEDDAEWEEHWEGNVAELYYEMPIEFCPICQFQALDRDLALKYLALRANMPHRADILKALKAEFVDFAEFKAFVRERFEGFAR